VAAYEIDDYLAGLPDDQSRALDDLRRSILKVVPDAEQCISYKLPAFRVDGKVVAGFGAFSNHLSYLPHSGSVLGALGLDAAGYDCTKSSLHFTPDRPLPDELVERLVRARLSELADVA
jgi:uncharacterized protein YdhG (YjbR/CyaY superfamily)